MLRMRMSRRSSLIVTTIVVALVIGVGAARPYAPISWFVGGTYEVHFSKGLCVGFLASPSYDLRLVAVEGAFACFSDDSGRFERSHPGNFVDDVGGRRELLVFHRVAGGLCVRASQISALFFGGWRVWGAYSARGTPGA